MATKVYGIYGRTSVEINLQVGKATLRLEFTGGCLDRKNFRAASHIESRPAIQAMIEDSPLYGNIIKLIKVYGEGAKSAEQESKPVKKAVVKTSEASASEATDYPEVTTKEEAYAVLKSLGAKAVELKDLASFKATMNRLNVTFSNYKF